MTTPAALHSSASAEWYTPADVLNRVRAVLGFIDLDPASTWEANQVVGASGIFTKEVDGLAVPWYGKVWVNPPGGKRGKDSLPRLFWTKLLEEMAQGRVEQAMWMSFSLEQLAQLPLTPDCIVSVPEKRIKFVPGDGSKAGSPTHSNAIIGVGVDFTLFANTFADYGKILCPYR